jgi:hypothetical protein
MLCGMPAAPVTPLRTYRILALALMGALVVIGIALWFTVGANGTDRSGNAVPNHAPSGWLYVAIAALGLIAASLIQTFGYRFPALSPDLDPAAARAAGLRVYQQSMYLRFALSESVAIIAIALLFSGNSNTILPYVLAAAIAALLMAYHVWPSASLISRVEQRLDRNGGRSDLANALDGTG